MAWIAKDFDGEMYVYLNKPYRTDHGTWMCKDSLLAKIDSDSDFNLFEKRLTWEDEPVEI